MRLAFVAFALAAAAAQSVQPWRQSFPVDVKTLATEGESRYFILKPGYRLTLEGRENGKATTLLVTVLTDTVDVGGVRTRVVEERESHGGALVEVSRNFFAIDPSSSDVYYFGEDVDMYKNGKVVNHQGSWRHGERGAHFGLYLPGKPAVGMRFYQELAKGVALDRAEIVSLTEKISTRGGSFERCLETKETTPLEPLAHESKTYAPGVGLVKDGSLELISRDYVK
jgi:hypothetical protein